jgi:cation transport regulator ChaC
VTLISRSYWEQLTDHHDSAPDRVWGVAYRITPDRVAEVKEYLDIREINGYTIHYTPFHPASASASASTSNGTLNTSTTVLPVPQQQHEGPIQTLVYIGTPDNEQFVGPQDPQQLAEHIYRSVGPSGLNRDYLWGLETALDELSPESGDAHVTDLSDRVRAVAAREAQQQQVAETKERERKLQKGERAVQTDDDDDRTKVLSPHPPVSSAVVVSPGPGSGSERVLERERRHHEQHHDFRRVSSVDEQEETEKTS